MQVQRDATRTPLRATANTYTDEAKVSIESKSSSFSESNQSRHEKLWTFALPQMLSFRCSDIDEVERGTVSCSTDYVSAFQGQGRALIFDLLIS